MDKTFYARSDFNECAVISDNDNFTFNFVADFEVLIKCFPRMRGKLFETKSDAFFLVVEVDDNNLKFLIQVYNLFRMRYSGARRRRSRTP